ncbi:MAG TPA: hypothetical protein VMU14_04305, partial [Acidimicrobiales bacterium]|nr:hypothetical protein [Acidimicrobiales bacterium]
MPAGSALLVVLAHAVTANTLTVNGTGDTAVADGVCTLREAFAAASGSPNADCGTATGDVTIAFSVTTPATITVGTPLTLGSFAGGVTSLTVSGPGEAKLTVDGGNATNIFALTSYASTRVTFSGLTIAHGIRPVSTGWAGAITANVPMTLDHVTFTGEQSVAVVLASGSGYGATGLTNYVTSSTFSQNAAIGLWVQAADPVSIDQSSFIGNTGLNSTGAGAILCGNYTTVSAARSYFYGNSSWGDGGAIECGGALTLTDDVFDSNQSGVMVGSPGGRGGAVFFSGPYSPVMPLIVSRCTFSNNVAHGDGGALLLNNLTTSALDNTTFFGNQANATGGAIGSYGSITTSLVNVTVVGNTSGMSVASGGGGIAFDSGTMTLESTIVSGNANHLGGVTPAPDCTVLTGGQHIVSLGYDFFGSLAGCALTQDATDVVGAALLLDTALARNGNSVAAGATADVYAGTLLPAAGSPVINAGPTTCAGTASVDERQATRTVLDCDSGAVETPCGNSVTDPGEECDTGASLANTGACTLGCRSAVCGDGFVWTDHEQCDLGAGNSATGACTPACKNAVCGDGYVWSGHEQCDNGGSNGATTCAYGQTSCSVCTASCTTAAGTPSYCGDGAVDPSHEQCDNGSSNGATACAYGQASCTVCTTACTTAAGTTSYCGDGVLDANHEQCDAGAANTLACAYGQQSCTVCSPTCVSQAGTTSYCGDGVLDANHEACDAGTANTLACAYGQHSCTVCSPTCASQAGTTSYCGDGKVD